MTIVSDAQLRALRGIQQDNMPHRCTLERLTDTPLDSGGSVTTWVPYATNVPCRLSPISGTELPRGLVLTPQTNFRLVFAYGSAVAPEDRAVVTGETDGVTWSKTIGFTFIDTPKAFQSALYTYGTDQAVQTTP